MIYEDEAADTLLVTCFTIGESSFGVDARLVQEVVKVGELTRVHNAPSAIVGIRNLRGRIVTVMDLAMLLGLGSVAVSGETRMLIIENQSETYGLLVDAVNDAIAVDEELIVPPPASLEAFLQNCLRGVWRESDHLTAILDTQALFQWDEPEV